MTDDRRKVSFSKDPPRRLTEVKGYTGMKVESAYDRNNVNYSMKDVLHSSNSRRRQTASDSTVDKDTEVSIKERPT